MKKTLAILFTILIMASLFAAQDVTVRLGGAYGLSVGKTARDAVDTELDRAAFSLSGLGFDAGIEFDLGSNLILYSDFSMTFPSEVTLKDTYSRDYFKGQFETTKEYWEKGAGEDFYAAEGSSFLSTIDIHMGLSKCIFSNDDLALYLGAGFGLYRSKLGYRMTMLKDGYTDIYYLDDFKIVATVSADVYARFAYCFSERFSLSVIAMPGLSFFSVTREHQTAKGILPSSIVGPIPLEGRFYFNPDSYSDPGSPETKVFGINPISENSGFSLGFNLGVKLGLTYTF